MNANVLLSDSCHSALGLGIPHEKRKTGKAVSELDDSGITDLNSTTVI